jgi:aryl-alcohol dehydrogenase-like predicted oxidoreductase
MKTRRLGNQGLDITEIGLGCWQLGTAWGNVVEESVAFDILQTAIDKGITFFDTADIYGAGRSETLIGEFLKGKNYDIKVATKFGRSSDVFPDNYTKDSLRRCVEDSLQRLQMDQLDLLQLHCIPVTIVREGKIFDWLRELKDEGLIRYFGASVEAIEDGMLCMEQEGLQSLQVIFNVLRQKPTEKLFPTALEKGVGIIVRLPLASGLLAGKYTTASTFPENDHRNFNKDGEAFNVGETFSGLPFDKGVEFTNKLKSMKPESMSMVDFTLRWILDHEAVTTIIPGASRPDQVVSNVKAASFDALNEQLHNELLDFYQTSVHQFVRGAY